MAIVQVLMWELYFNETPYVVQDGNYLLNPNFGLFTSTAPLNYALLSVACLSQAPEDR
jgi:hypothetical protein